MWFQSSEMVRCELLHQDQHGITVNTISISTINTNMKTSTRTTTSVSTIATTPRSIYCHGPQKHRNQFQDHCQQHHWQWQLNSTVKLIISSYSNTISAHKNHPHHHYPHYHHYHEAIVSYYCFIKIYYNHQLENLCWNALWQDICCDLPGCTIICASH